MSDRDIPSVPVTTLAGLNSLSDLLSELPVTESLPSVSSQKKSLLFHTLVAEESKNLLSVRDDSLVKQLVNAIEQTNSDHIELKSQYSITQHGTNISGLPELLQGIYQHRPTVFNAPNSANRYSELSLNRQSRTSDISEMDHQMQSPTHEQLNDRLNQPQTIATQLPPQQSSVILQTPQLNQHSSVITLNNRNNSSLQQSANNNVMHNHNNLPQPQDNQSQIPNKTTPRNNEYLQQQSIQTDVRGPSPAQASIAPESSTPPSLSQISTIKDEKISNKISTGSGKLLPKVCIPRMKPEEEKLMQESISKFAEKQPELAKKFGIKSESTVTKTSGDIFSDMKNEEKRVPKRKLPIKVEEEFPPEKIFSQPKVRKVERLVAAPPQKSSKEEIMKSQSYQQFMKNMDIIIEQLDDTEQPNFNSDDVDETVECIPSKMLTVMSNDVAKLKARAALDTIPKNKLTLLINYAMRNIYLAKNYAAGPDEDDEIIGEEVIDKILNAIEACLLICNIYSTVKDIKFLQEDNITMILKFLQFQLKETIYPSYDPVYTCLKSTKKEKKKSKSQQNYHSRGITILYSKSVELIKVLVTLFDKCVFVDTIVLSLSTMAIEPFFVDNIDTLQFVCLELVTTIFRKESYEKIRSSILTDIFTSIDRLPCSKKNLRPFKLANNGGSIQMVTALILQLVQCSTILPDTFADFKKGKSNENNEDTTDTESKSISDKDIKILKKFDVAIGIGANFLTTFLSKCKSKSNETDFRPLFENFIYDLLSTVNKPEWPASELLLSLLGALLVRCMSDKTKEISTRLASLDYLGIVAARLRKDTVESKCKVHVIDAMIASIKVEQEKEGDFKKKNNKIVLDPEEERTEFLQKILLDYLAVNAQEENLVWDYARHFYLVQWYRDIINQRKRIAEGEKGYASKKRKTQKKKRKNTSRSDEELTSSTEEEDDEDDENLKKSSKMIDVELNLEIFKILDSRKRYLISKVKAFSENNCTSQHIKTYIDYNNAHLIAQYLASKRTFSQSFDKFLQKIILVVNENSIAIRTRAIKCLANIVEVDPLVLKRKDMQIGVNQKFLDQAISVREAAVDLIGKYVLNSEELIDQYYDIISQRILDTGVSVRKRVIKILRDICIEYPDFDKIPEICVKMIRRVNDEEGIQKLVTEVFMKMWFTACKDNNKATIQRKISQIIDVVNISHETGTTWVEGLLTSIFAPKENSKGDTAMGEPIKKNTEAPPEIVLACQQLADGLVDRLILLEDIDNTKMYGCITTLHLFAKARPELLVRHAITIEPYLNMRGQTAQAQKFICCVADILEKVVPLVTNPSESFLASLEEHLMFLVISFNQAVVSSCISCLSALVNKITKNYKLIRDCFVRFYKQMVKSKEHVLANPTITLDKIYTPIFRRSLFTIGILMRYFDFKSRKVLGIDEGDTTISPNVCDEVFHLLMYFSTYDSLEIRKQALVALGQFCVQNDEYLTRTDLKEFYCDLLKIETVEPFMKTSVMRNIWLYLTESENLMFNKEKDWEKQAKTENLKEMNDVTSGMASRIIQLYLEEILACFLHQDYSVRLWAVKVVAIVLRQGLVAPQRMVPWLIALSTDEKQETAHRADALLKEIDKTYVGYINQKIQSGLQTSFKLQKIIKGESAIVRGYMKRDPNSTVPTSLNDFVYTLLRTTKPQRRAFIHTVTKQFDDLKTTLKQMLYLADNLAYFPYVVQDEPLYLIHQIDLMISVTGTNLLQTFKEGLKPPEGERDILEDDDDEEDPDVLVQRLPDETKELEKCITSAQGCMLLLVLKQHLKDMYGLTDGKISRYSPSETQKIYEKNITRKNVPEFNPKTTIEIIKNDTSALSQLDSSGRKDLVVKYLDFKQLMLKLDPDEEDSATEDLNKSKLNNTSTFNSDGTEPLNDSSVNLNSSSCVENSTQEAIVDQTDCSVNKVNYNKSNKEVQGTPLTKSSKSTPSKPPPRRQPSRSKRKKRKMISSDDDEEDDDEDDDDDYDGFS